MLKHCSSTLDIRTGGDKIWQTQEHMGEHDRNKQEHRASHVRKRSKNCEEDIERLSNRFSSSMRCGDEKKEARVRNQQCLTTSRQRSPKQSKAIMQTEPIRVYASCLRADIEYRTVRINKTTTAKQVIMGLLNKYRLKHMDRNMFFLAMEVTIEEGKRTMIKIGETNYLSEILSCNPWRDVRVVVCSKPCVCVRVYDSAIIQDSVYKSICVSEDTSVREVIDIVLLCCNSSLSQEFLCLVLHTGTTTRVMDREEGVLELVTRMQEEQIEYKLVVEYKHHTEESHRHTGTHRRGASLGSLDSFDSGYSGLSWDQYSGLSL